MDNGKSIRESRDLDIPIVARHFYHHAGTVHVHMHTLTRTHTHMHTFAELTSVNVHVSYTVYVDVQ